MSALRFALAVAFSRDRRQRWRQISLIVGGGICLWALLLSLGLLGAVATATTHSDARQPTIVMPAYTGDLKHDDALGPPDGATIRMVQRATVIDGAQVSTVWIEPLPGHENDPSTIPPGLRSLPAPGTAILSPGLVNAGHSARELGWKPSHVGTGPGGAIGQEGLLTTSERIIYVRPAAGRDLGIGTTPSYAKGFGTPGYTPDYEDDGGTVVDGFADMFEQDPELLAR